MKTKVIGIALAALALTASAYADVMQAASPTCAVNVCFILGNNHFPDEQNILFQTAQTSTTILGHTNKTDTEIVFTSSQTLVVQGHGQSGITPSTGNNISNLTITAPGEEFTDFIINPHKGNNAGNITITAFTESGGVFTSAPFGGNGSNFMTILAAPGVELVKITMSAGNGVNTVSQNRISGITEAPIIPEPSTMLLLGSGVLVLAQGLRRKLL